LRSDPLDASILADILLLTPRGQRAAALVHPASDFHLPHLADVETASVVRNPAKRGLLTADRAAAALVDLREFPRSAGQPGRPSSACGRLATR
jgi:predicted nucleic acid-binding protein